VTWSRARSAAIRARSHLSMAPDEVRDVLDFLDRIMEAEDNILDESTPGDIAALIEEWSR
jgi:hypothetical protein